MVALKNTIHLPTQLEQLLTQNFEPSVLQIQDDSNTHARGTHTHYSIVLVSSCFELKKTFERHQMVMRLLTPLFSSTSLHGVVLTLKTSQEWSEKNVVASMPPCKGKGAFL